MPSLIASKRKAALIRSHLSTIGSSKNSRSSFISNLCKPLVYQSSEQCVQITLTPLGLNIIFVYKYIPNLPYSFGLLEQVPNPGPYGIQAVVRSTPEIQDCDF